MQIKKAFISIILLLSFSLGISHNLILHCHELDNEEQQYSSHHHHEHHKHTFDQENDLADQHIFHNDHFDLNTYDLITCFLSEIEHPTNDCNLEHYIPLKSENNLNKQFSKIKIVSVQITVWSLTDQIESLSTYNKEVVSQYLSPPLGNSPNRGPPSISC